MIEDYNVIEEAEMIAQANEEDYQNLKENMIDRIAEHAISQDMEKEQVGYLIVTACNCYGRMPAEDVLEVASTVFEKIDDEESQSNMYNFILCRMSPYYEARWSKDGELIITLLKKADGDIT
jgi:hypothetical protein